MKRKVLIFLFLIGLVSFNFTSCISGRENAELKNEKQESITNEDQNKNESINKSDSDLDSKSSEGNKADIQEKNTVVKENNNKTIQESKKQIYKKKLDDIQLGLKDLDSLYAGNTIEMKSAASQEYERWDKALNEIYGVLKQQLSSDDMNKLKEEQIKWISDRDAKAKKESLEYEGGTAEQLIYTSSLAQTTKERCYRLVEKYMK